MRLSAQSLVPRRRRGKKQCRRHSPWESYGPSEKGLGEIQPRCKCIALHFISGARNVISPLLALLKLGKNVNRHSGCQKKLWNINMTKLLNLSKGLTLSTPENLYSLMQAFDLNRGTAHQLTVRRQYLGSICFNFYFFGFYIFYFILVNMSAFKNGREYF